MGGAWRDAHLPQYHGTRLYHSRRPHGGGGGVRQRHVHHVIELSPFRLVIFDKDGTLIDFDAMWSGWVETLAARLETATGCALAPGLFAGLGYDAAHRRTIAGGRLAVTSMADLFRWIFGYLKQHGLTDSEAEV